MNQSVKTDPVTGRPVEEGRKGQADKKAALAKAKLEEQYEFGSVLDSIAAERLIGEIEEGLIEAFGRFLKQDPAGEAYLKMIKRLGGKRKMAERAAAILIEKNWGPQKDG